MFDVICVICYHITDASYFRLFKGNNGEGDHICTVPLDPVSATEHIMKEKWGCQNDEARSVVICNGRKETTILFYSGSYGPSTSESFARIIVSKTMEGCITIPRFDMTANLGANEELAVFGEYATTLGGDVSSFKILFWQ